MYGFLVTRNYIPKQIPFDDDFKYLSHADVHFYYHPLPKFENDHLFYEDDEKIVLLDGVIFNNHELMAQYGCNTWRETFDRMYHCSGRTVMKDLRGSSRRNDW